MCENEWKLNLTFIGFAIKKPIHPLFMSFAHLKGQNITNDLINAENFDLFNNIKSDPQIYILIHI